MKVFKTHFATSKLSFAFLTQEANESSTLGRLNKKLHVFSGLQARDAIDGALTGKNAIVSFDIALLNLMHTTFSEVSWYFVAMRLM